MYDEGSWQWIFSIHVTFWIYFRHELFHVRSDSFYFVQLLLITIIYIQMYSVTLTRVMRIFPLHVRLVKTRSGFYALCFALKFDCQSFLPNRFVILLSTGQEGCIMQRNVRYMGELHCVLSSCKLCSLNVFGNLSENKWKLLNMYTTCCSKYW